jgi:hypothetical protein
MTSANTIEYTIFDKNNKEVGRHSQNIMCSTCNDGLEKFQPYEDFTIQPWGYDEEEELWENPPVNLKDWISKHPAEFTFKRFEKDDKVRVALKVDGKFKRVNAVIVERLKDKFFDKYTIKTDSGEIIEDIGQNLLLPF